MRRPVLRRRATVAALAVAGSAVLAPVVAAAALLIAVPPPVDGFDPEPWSSPPASDADRALHEPLRPEPASVRLDGPEDVAVDAAGRRYTGDRHGVIWRVSADGRTERFAEVGGRPLGLAFGPEGELLVANHGSACRPSPRTAA